ncbi:MAG: hypothetical protein ACI8Z1_002477 [Candidatus Azotimanducaceae bacterium]|jgi:hypothetical protein
MLCDAPANDAQTLKNFSELSTGAGNWLFRAHDLLTRFGPKRAGMEGLDLLNQDLLNKGTTLVMVPVRTRALVHAQKLGGIDYDVIEGVRAYGSYLDRLRAIGVVVSHL